MNHLRLILVFAGGAVGKEPIAHNRLPAHNRAKDFPRGPLATAPRLVACELAATLIAREPHRTARV